MKMESISTKLFEIDCSDYRTPVLLDGTGNDVVSGFFIDCEPEWQIYNQRTNPNRAIILTR
jgi:hypothetical protein